MDKIAKLVIKLHELTLAGRLNWEPGTAKDTYEVSFAHGSVKITRVFEDEFFVHVLDDNAQVVELTSDTQLDSFRSSDDVGGFGNYFGLMKDLHERARRWALGADQVIDDILKEMDSQS